MDVTSATLTIPAPADRVFAVLVDPAAHAAIDGTGWVRRPVDPAPLTGAGQVFRMNMHHDNHPDGDYRTANQVWVFDPPTALGWRTGGEDAAGEFRSGGWTWRYDLAAIEPSRTRVTLTYDWSAVPAQTREQLPFPPFGPGHLDDSLRHLSELVTVRAGSGQEG